MQHENGWSAGARLLLVDALSLQKKDPKAHAFSTLTERSMEVIRQIKVPKDVTVVQRLLGPRSEESHFQEISHLISVNASIFV